MRKKKEPIPEEPGPPPVLQITPLGGVGEIGKNMTAYRYQDEILIVDCGFAFPEAEMLGVDVVIPDMTYIIDNAEKVVAVVLTHGHEDHVGGLPYLLKQVNVPIYGTRLTLGLIQGKLAEHGMTETTEVCAVEPGDRTQHGSFEVEWIYVTHSVPGSCSLAIRTPAGIVLHTGDFKFDPTPVDGNLTDLAALAKLGKEGVLALISDSTNVEKPGNSPSEQLVSETLDAIFRDTTGRIIIASFASALHRIQQVVRISEKYGRKVAFVGRSMEQNVRVARDLGYLTAEEGTIVSLGELNQLPPDEFTAMTTGSQGEPLSALSRIAVDEHKKLKVGPGDTVIISAHAIPGNEDLVWRTVNNLFRRGARVIYDTLAAVHASGHAYRDELRMMINLIRPEVLIPMHGEARHMYHYREMAVAMGYPEERIFQIQLGDLVEISAEGCYIVGKVPHGSVLVDGIGVGDVEDPVLRDRQHLSQDGVFVVTAIFDRESGELIAGPDIMTRGFVFEQESEDLVEEARQLLLEQVGELTADTTDWSALKSELRSRLNKFLYKKTHRRPMVLPMIIEV
ncbi:MAG TPA: ribonuclease J [Armatimonadota bacterium]